MHARSVNYIVQPRCDRTFPSGITYAYCTYVMGKNNVRVRGTSTVKVQLNFVFKKCNCILFSRIIDTFSVDFCAHFFIFLCVTITRTWELELVPCLGLLAFFIVCVCENQWHIQGGLLWTLVVSNLHIVYIRHIMGSTYGRITYAYSTYVIG